jgi:hypothetical protein
MTAWLVWNRAMELLTVLPHEDEIGCFAQAANLEAQSFRADKDWLA